VVRNERWNNPGEFIKLPITHHKKPPPLKEGAIVVQQQTCKPGSVSNRFTGLIPIINLALPLPAGLNNLPILASRRTGNGNEQLRFQDLFGFSTPEVYRDPGRPGKP
jgi:hypothetical protein